MSSIRNRTLTGLVLVVVITGCLFAGIYTFLLLLLAINWLGLMEFYRLFRSAATTPRTAAGIVLSTVIILSVACTLKYNLSYSWLAALVPLAFFVFLLELYQKSGHPFQNLAFTFLGILFITVPLSFFLATALLPWAKNEYKPEFILGYFILLWTSDTMAYLLGNWFGKHKLFVRISPNKTWEGSIGGGLSTILSAFLISRYLPLLSTTQWLTVAVLVAIFGTYGDLLKSMMKRSLGVKDAGTILPGHGGILDRFDSLLGSAPFVLLYLLLTQHE